MANKFLPLLLFGALCACNGSRTGLVADAPVKTPVARSEIVSLPSGMSPTRVFTTKSLSLVIKGAAGSAHRSLYSWEPDKAPKLIVEGRDLDVSRLSDDLFAAWYFDDTQEVIVTLNAQQLISQPLALPKGGPTGWGGCEGDTHYLVCIGDRPGMTVEDNDYDEMGFTAILVIDLARRKITWFPVGHRTHLRFDLGRKMIYVIDWTAPSIHGSAVAFDLVGEERGAAQSWDIMPLSPSGRFAESLQADGSESWEVYDASNKRVLLAFNCERPECKVGDRDDQHWNPIFTDQLIAFHSEMAYGKDGACDLYQVSPPRLVKTISCSGLPVYDWSRDGRELVSLQDEGGELRREPLN
jgi:hypothetical protein